MNSVCLRVLVLLLVFESGHSNSPCDDIFGFFTDDKHEFGEITLKPVEDYIGRLDSPEDVLRKYNRGETVKYRVYFPVKSPRPKVTSISINDAAICTGPGDQSRHQVVTRASIRNLSYNAVGDGPPRYKRSSHKPLATAQPTPQYIPPKMVYNPHPNSDDEKYIKAFILERFGNPHGQASNQINPSITTEECGLVVGGNDRVALINNGVSFERGEIPWLVAIYRTIASPMFICGGTLVSDRHVVTAAHCMSRRGVKASVTELLIKVGVHKLNNWADSITVNRNVLEAKIFEGYDSFTLKNDILILIMDQRVKFNHYIRPACLWSGDTELSRVVGGVGVVAGWGARTALDAKLYGVDEPLMARVPIVSTKECRASKSDFHSVTYNNTLCAGGRNGEGPCTGDSGGGLYLLDDGKWKLRGIVSVSLTGENGYRTCNLKEYVVYTDTAQFLPWIRNILSMKYYD